MDSYKRLADYEPTDEELEAGIEQLNAFGSFGTATALARKSNMRTEEIFELPAARVYHTLLLDFEEAEYQKKLADIHRRNMQLGQHQP